MPRAPSSAAVLTGHAPAEDQASSPCPSPLRATALKTFARCGSGSTSVIVEARQVPQDIPRALLDRRLATRPADVLPRPAAPRRKGSAAASRDDGRAALDQLGDTLERLGLDTHARRNELACAYVVEVTPDQLERLAQEPSVQAIRPNRIRKAA